MDVAVELLAIAIRRLKFTALNIHPEA